MISTRCTEIELFFMYVSLPSVALTGNLSHALICLPRKLKKRENCESVEKSLVLM